MKKTILALLLLLGVVTFTPGISGNSTNDIHDNPGAKQLGVKVEIGLILMQDLP